MDEQADLKRECQDHVSSTLLPQSIRQKLRPLLSLRHSVSNYSIRGRKRHASEQAPPRHGRENPAPRPPPPAAPPADTKAVALGRPLDDVVPAEPAPSRYSGPPASGRTAAPGTKQEISWKHARQGPFAPPRPTGQSLIETPLGLQLLQASLAEAERRQHAPAVGGPDGPHADYDPAFERKSFVDGFVYLAEALPRDLTPDEALPVDRSLPPALRDRHRDRRSFVHRVVQTVVVIVIIACDSCAPFLVRGVRRLLAFDKKHRISARIFAWLLALVTMAGTTGLSASTWLLDSAAAAGAGAGDGTTGDGSGEGMAGGAAADETRQPPTTTATMITTITSDGRLVGLAADTAQWVFGGIASGVSDGAREGLWKVRINARAKNRE